MTPQGLTVVSAGLTLAAVAAATLVRWMLDGVLGDSLPFFPFFLTVVGAAWLGGWRPAVLATAASFTVALYLFVPPRFSLFGASPAHFIGMLLSLAVTLCVIALIEVMHATRRRLEHERLRFRLAADAVNGLVYEFDLTTGHVDRLRGLFELIGHRPEDVPATAAWWREQIHPDDVAPARRQFEEAAATGSNVLTSYRLRHKDGRWLHVEDRALVVRDAAERIARLIGCTVDVTPRVRAEEAEARSRRLFEKIAATTPDLVYVFDLVQRRNIYINPAVTRVLGYTPEQLAAMGPDVISSLVHPDDAVGVHGGFARAETQEHEVRMQHADGEYRWLQCRETVFERDADGQPTRMIGTARDVTGQKAQQEALRQERDRLDFVVRACGIGLWFNPLPLGQLDWNEHVKRHFHLPPDAVPTIADFYDRLHPDDREPTRRAVNEAVETGCLLDVEYRTVCPRTGAVKWVRAVGKSILGSDGRAVHFDGITLDLTARKQAEEGRAELVSQLQEADRRKNEFLATLAHELRNPLAPIRNGLHVLKLAGADPETELARAMMERQLGQMVRLIDDLMDVSRITRGKVDLRRQPVDLAKVIQHAVETSRPLIDERGHRLTVDPSDEPIHVDGDETRLAQVFANLLNNAAKYTDAGGRITLGSKAVGGQAVVTVADTGIGIPAAMLGRVFEMFTQVDRSLEKAQGGLGIGLSLVKGLVEMHGGTVEAHSAGHGRGSQFVVRLPTVAAVAPSAPAPEPAPTGRRRILVADDNADAAVSLAILLRLSGHDVRTAHDGQEAVDVAEAFRPDVILLDIGMPRLNGYEACRRIRGREWARAVMLVACTGWGQEEDRQRSHEAGFDVHVVKPVEPDALERLLAGR